MEMAMEIISLLTGLVGLISAGVTAFFAVKTFIQSFKDKKATEIWELVMALADIAMAEAEKNTELDADGKKQQVMNMAKAGLEAAGLDITDFLVRLDKYIDDTIKFTNKMQEAKKLKELNK